MPDVDELRRLVRLDARAEDASRHAEPLHQGGHPGVERARRGPPRRTQALGRRQVTLAREGQSPGQFGVARGPGLELVQFRPQLLA